MRPTTFDLQPDAQPTMDVAIMNHGSVWSMTPLTTRAADWMLDNIPHALALGVSRMVEHRYGEGILLAMQKDGLVV